MIQRELENKLIVLVKDLLKSFNPDVFDEDIFLFHLLETIKDYKLSDQQYKYIYELVISLFDNNTQEFEIESYKDHIIEISKYFEKWVKDEDLHEIYRKYKYKLKRVKEEEEYIMENLTTQEFPKHPMIKPDSPYMTDNLKMFFKFCIEVLSEKARLRRKALVNLGLVDNREELLDDFVVYCFHVKHGNREASKILQYYLYKYGDKSQMRARKEYKFMKMHGSTIKRCCNYVHVFRNYGK